ncbi:MAG: histidine kinase [Candidatus Azobacteroides sp.]|nr:histidine kinase [Candidatus Azobacteroides sp.]
MRKEDIKKLAFNFLLTPGYRFFRHFLFVIVVVIICAGIIVHLPPNIGSPSLFVGLIGYSGIVLTVTYLNIYWGIPRFLLKNRLGFYFIFIFFLTVAAVLFLIFLQTFFLKLHEQIEIAAISVFLMNLLSSIVILSFTIMGTSTLFLLKHWIVFNRRIDELQAANLESELSQLKNQINPHFLFNMLNNALVLLKENKGNASQVLHELEGFLRYQIENGAKKQISLEADIQFLKDFLNLEKIRRDNFDFRFSVNGEIGNVFVPPLIFIPFIENSVKHSQDNERSSYVEVLFSVSGKNILFCCINSKPISEDQFDNRVRGLGLKNVKRRLELLFPDKHVLTIIKQEKNYAVKLQLTL